MNHKTHKTRYLNPSLWSHQYPGSSGSRFQQGRGLRTSGVNRKQRFHRIDGHQPHLVDRRITGLDHDGRCANWEKTSSRIIRLLRKFRAQPDCRSVRIRTVARPWLALASPPLKTFWQPATPQSAEGPLETWSAAQDLWRRLGVICPAKIFNLDDSFELVFAHARALDWDQDSVDLIERALDQHAYRWCHQGRQGDFAQCVEMRGNDLVVRLSTFEKMVRWPEGQELVCQIKSDLMHIRSSVAEDSESTGASPK